METSSVAPDNSRVLLPTQLLSIVALRHQCGIFAFIPQTLFLGETSSGTRKYNFLRLMEK